MKSLAQAQRHAGRHAPTPSPAARRFAAAAAALWLGALAAEPAVAQIVPPPVSGRLALTMGDDAAAHTVAVVYHGSFSFVRIERAEDGAAPSLHPAKVEAAELRQLLAGVRLGSGSLFNDDELAEIVPPLAAALARAAPDQDVSFAVAGKHYGLGPFAPRSVTTGRMFRSAEGLQLIVGLAQRPFESQYVATGHLIPFDPGRRRAPVDRSVKVAVPAELGSERRGDWLALDLPGEMLLPAPEARAIAASAAPPGLPARVRASAAAPGGDPRERLKALQRLRDAGLISAQEYEDKRQQIARGL